MVTRIATNNHRVLVRFLVADGDTHCLLMQYDPDMDAPTVITRGSGRLAAALRSAAYREAIRVIDDVTLAGSIDRAVPQNGAPIPKEFYECFAQIVANIVRDQRVVYSAPCAHCDQDTGKQ